MKIKLFFSFVLSDLENEVNEWLYLNDEVINVRTVGTTISEKRTIIITILYESK